MNEQAGILRQIGTLFDAGPSGLLADSELLDRFLSREGGDAEAAFGALVDRHGPMVLGVCRRVLRDPDDAQDAFQATFLVLARKAGRIGRPERLASWLYGVASRTAMKARATAARRRRHERARAESVAEGRRDDHEGRELRAVLDEEITRLPEKYREPVVLCHLEGMSRERASAQLRCPEGTVGVRLMRARERLRAGLARRGFAVAAGALAVDLGSEASAAVPSSLVAATAAAGTAFKSGRIAAAGVVPARAATLARGVLRTMFIERTLMVAPAVVLVGVAAAGAGYLATKPQEPATVEASWKTTLPGGATVELLGVASGTVEDGTNAWWSPSGASLTAAPFDGLRRATLNPAQGSQLRFFAARVEGPPGPNANLRITWDVPGRSGLNTGPPEAKGRSVPEGVHGAVVSLPRVATATVRVGVASGPWAVLARSDGNTRGTTSFDGNGGGVVFSRARAVGDRTALVISESIKEMDYRIVAIDRDGVDHEPATANHASAGSARMHDLEFDLPPDKIREFQFRFRPYEWAEFRDVAVEPTPKP